MSKEAKVIQEHLQSKDSNQLNFKRLNTLGGWAVFAIATVTYLLTVERTASFWDCGEFIACAYKLQVPHPPGAPIFLLVGRMFSFFAAGDVMQVAYWINVSSVLCSAFTILFLFWTITLLGVKLLPERNIQKLTDGQIITLLGAGTIGSLAYTFSDSFWFSAVEAEVYAMSSFFTAFVVWAILKWELIEDDSQANKWLILTAYMMGLSIGVHLLNLVTVPALGLIYYYKKYKETSVGGVLATMAIGGAVIIFILEGIIPGLPSLAGSFEILFVNTFGFPFGSGVVFITLSVLGSLVYAIIYSVQKQKVVLNTALLSLAFILIGYASYTIILVRSNYNPPINENDPSDIIRFVSYLKREQYGDRPLMYGPTFASDVKRDDNGSPVQVSKGKVYRMNKKEGIYEVYDERMAYIYEDNMVFPRVYSRQGDHRRLYLQRIRGTENVPEDFKPTMRDNLSFFFSYQVGHMYFRYFLWNFMGRQGGFEGAWALTPTSDGVNNLPHDLKRDKARNNFYMLPLILGLIGAVFCFQRSQQTFFVTFMLFFLTGLALVMYLNSPPIEPRERDYIYVGSFYAFAIWIGFGVLFLSEVLQGFIKNTRLAPIVATCLALVVPGIMAVQGWDDHDRSNRYHSVDSAKNLLNSCAPNAVLFTGGDNDTFPLWYVQEVEGFRTDVRVCNLSLLGTDWYINQMKRQAYESEALPISLSEKNYLQGKNDQILYPLAWRIQTNLSQSQLEDISKQGMDLNAYLKLVEKDDKQVQGYAGEEKPLTIIPSKKLVYKFDKNKVLALGHSYKVSLATLKLLQEDGVPKTVISKLKKSVGKRYSSKPDFDRAMTNIIGQGDFGKYKEKLYKETSMRAVPKNLESRLKGYISWELSSNELYKNDLMILDMIATGGWERPIYFSTTLAKNSYLNLKEYMQREGLAYRLLPVKMAGATDGYTNTDIMYENMTKKFFWRELDNKGTYYDDNYLRFTLNIRDSFYKLAMALLQEGKKEKAKKAILFALDKMPDETIPYDVYTPQLVEALFKVGEEKKAKEMVKVIVERVRESLKYYVDEKEYGMGNVKVSSDLAILNQLAGTFRELGLEEDAKEFETLLQMYYQKASNQ